MLINMAFVANLNRKIFNPITPVIQYEREEACFIIFKPLFPAQQELYLALLTCLGDNALPEAWWLRDNHLSYWGLLSGWFPLRENFVRFQAQKSTACFLTDFFQLAKSVYTSENVRCICLALLAQRLYESDLPHFGEIAHNNKRSLNLFLVQTGM